MRVPVETSARIERGVFVVSGAFWFAVGLAVRALRA